MAKIILARLDESLLGTSPCGPDGLDPVSVGNVFNVTEAED